MQIKLRKYTCSICETIAKDRDWMKIYHKLFNMVFFIYQSEAHRIWMLMQILDLKMAETEKWRM